MRSNRNGRVLTLLTLLMLLLARPALAQKYVCMQSTQGEWCMELLRSAAPNAVTNFLRYVNDGKYANDLIHRSVPGFVIQGGGFNVEGSVISPVATYGTINNEFNRSNLRGTVAMAKVPGDPNSATSQWFVNLAKNVSLDLPANNSFTVFANVVYGMEVIDKIAALPVFDKSTELKSTAFLTMPLVATDLIRKNLVQITRAYGTDLLPGSTVQPYHCSAPVANEALTELCGKALTFPLSLPGSGGSWEVTLDLVTSQPTLVVFAVRPGSLKPLAMLPNSYASFNPATNVAVIPSVRVGAVIYDNVQLRMTNATAQQLTLQSYNTR